MVGRDCYYRHIDRQIDRKIDRQIDRSLDIYIQCILKFQVSQCTRHHAQMQMTCSRCSATVQREGGERGETDGERETEGDKVIQSKKQNIDQEITHLFFYQCSIIFPNRFPPFPSLSLSFIPLYAPSLQSFKVLVLSDYGTIQHTYLNNLRHTFQDQFPNVCAGDWGQLMTRLTGGKPRSDGLCCSSCSWQQLMPMEGGGKPRSDGLCCSSGSWQQLMPREGGGKPLSDGRP